MAVTGFLEISFDLDADYESPSWDVRGCDCGSLQMTWSGAENPNEATAVPQCSNDGVNWNDLSVSLGEIILDEATGTQVWEWQRFTTRYVRLKFMANGNSDGFAQITAWAHPIAIR